MVFLVSSWIYFSDDSSVLFATEHRHLKFSLQNHVLVNLTSSKLTWQWNITSFQYFQYVRDTSSNGWIFSIVMFSFRPQQPGRHGHFGPKSQLRARCVFDWIYPPPKQDADSSSPTGRTNHYFFVVNPYNHGNPSYPPQSYPPPEIRPY